MSTIEHYGENCFCQCSIKGNFNTAKMKMLIKILNSLEELPAISRPRFARRNRR